MTNTPDKGFIESAITDALDEDASIHAIPEDPSKSQLFQVENKRSSEHALLSWRLGAGLVGADIGTSVFYSTSVIMPYAGFLAPIIIAFVCLMMWVFKATYEEGCTVSPFNGGAYIMVLQTVGKRLAMLVGALTILSYLATAAVSALSGSYYLDSFDNLKNSSEVHILLMAIAPIVFFGLLNIKGIREPAVVVFLIALFHFTLLLGMDLFGLWQAFAIGADFSVVFKPMPDVTITPAGLLHGIAVAFLGITGFESAAQIVEQLRTPTWVTLKKIYTVVVILVGITAPLTSYLCLVLLSPEQLVFYKHHLLSGLAFVEGGETMQKILVCDAFLTLFAAVNTAYVGCIGLCTTMAKQGNLPGFLLRRWDIRWPWVQGYPFVVLPFMLITIAMMLMLPGKIDELGTVYGMAFLAVMSSFCLGVIMMRFQMPIKVLKSPIKCSLTIPFRGNNVPLLPLIGLVTLMSAEIVLLLSADQARTLGLQILLAILLVMCFYRLGLLEGRLRELPDLRLGLGRYAHMTELPDDLPVYVLCTAGAKARNLAHSIIKVLEREEPGPKEIIIYHAEEEDARRGIMYELLQRVVSQQIAPSFRHHDMILTVKILPDTLVDGLIHLKKAHPFGKIFIGTGSHPEHAVKYASNLEDSLGVPVVNIGQIVSETVPRFAKPDIGAE